MYIQSVRFSISSNSEYGLCMRMHVYVCVCAYRRTNKWKIRKNENVECSTCYFHWIISCFSLVHLVVLVRRIFCFRFFSTKLSFVGFDHRASIYIYIKNRGISTFIDYADIEPEWIMFIIGVKSILRWYVNDFFFFFASNNSFFFFSSQRQY